MDIYLKPDILNALLAAYESSGKYGDDYVHALNVIAVAFGLPKMEYTVDTVLNTDYDPTFLVSLPTVGLGTEIQTQ